jgi:hypothetical protein
MGKSYVVLLGASVARRVLLGMHSVAFEALGRANFGRNLLRQAAAAGGMDGKMCTAEL